MGADPAVRVSVPEAWAEVTGAVLMDLLGPFQESEEAGRHHFLFYPFRYGAGFVPDEDIRAVLPADPALRDSLEIERVLVPPGWEEGWKEHFRPQSIGRLYLRPPWEMAPSPRGPASSPRGPAPSPRGPVDVVLTPGLAFGTGLHPTTRGVLTLLQLGESAGPLLDAGTGSGILAIAAAKLGFAPVRAIDNDPLAVDAAHANAVANHVKVEVSLSDVSTAPEEWFWEATVLANITLDPVVGLLSRFYSGAARPRRLLVAGILAGEQERVVVSLASEKGFSATVRLYEKEWVSFDFNRRPL